MDVLYYIMLHVSACVTYFYDLYAESSSELARPCRINNRSPAGALGSCWKQGYSCRPLNRPATSIWTWA
jgi:hypothetical protein